MNIVLKDSKGKEDKYRILFDIETDKDKKYVIYTKDEVIRDDYIKTYVSIYKLNKKTKKYTITPIKSVKEIDFVDKILNSLQSESEN